MIRPRNPLTDLLVRIDGKISASEVHAQEHKQAVFQYATRSIARLEEGQYSLHLQTTRQIFCLSTGPNANGRAHSKLSNVQKLDIRHARVQKGDMDDDFGFADSPRTARCSAIKGTHESHIYNMFEAHS